jgi:uncharacterized protein involved in exopolysaccharide biosynthesis
MPEMHLTVEEDPSLNQVDDYNTPFSLIRKRFLAILAFSLIGAVLGWGTGVGNRDMFTSTALLLVSPYSLSVLDYAPASLNLSSDQVVIDTQMQLLRSPSTLDRVAKALVDAPAGSGALPTSPAGLREFIASNLNVRRVSSADIIEVSFSAADPDLAAFIANEVVSQFLQGQREAKTAELERIGTEIERRVAVLADSAQAADLEVAKARQAEAPDLAGEKDTLLRAIARLEQGMATLDDLVDGPDLVDAQTTLQDTRTALSDALSNLNTLNASSATADATRSSPEVLSTLVREAEVKANVHREMLQRLLEVRELANFVPDDARLVAPAVPSLTPSSIPPIVIAVMGLLAFALLGTLLAVTVATGVRPEKEWA